MARSAGGVTVNFTAGTATFLKDVELAETRIKQFGRSAGTSMGGARLAITSASAAVKELEGNFGAASRATGRFLADTLKLGPVLSAAFPVIGALAFGAVLAKIGEGVYKFFKDVANAPEKIAGAFRALNDPIRLANDELKLANDRLLNDIAKLEGKRQNNLAIALDEARVAADKLADSLDRDLERVEKFLKENEVGFWKGLLVGDASTSDIRKQLGGETGSGGFRAQIAQANDKIVASKTDTERKNAQKELVELYRQELLYLDGIISKSSELQQKRSRALATNGGITPGIPGVSQDALSPDARISDQSIRLELARAARRQISDESTGIGLSVTNENLKEKKTGLEIDKANSAQNRPYGDKIAALTAQLEGSKEKLGAAGLSESYKLLSAAAAEYLKISAEISKLREKNNLALDPGKEKQIAELIRTNLLTEAEAAWANKLSQGTDKIEERIQSLNLLTAAIGKGYEATREANVETRIATEFADKLKDSKYAQSDKGMDEMALRRFQVRGELDKEHSRSLTETLDKLNDQVEMEKAIVAVQHEGLAAVQAVEFAKRLELLADKEGINNISKIVEKETELFQLRRINSVEEEIFKLGQKKSSLDAVTGAILQGAEAERKAGLEAKYRQMVSAGQGGAVPASRLADEALHQQELVRLATQTGMEYSNQLEKLRSALSVNEQLRKDQGDSLALAISHRDIENQILEVQAKQSLQLHTLSGGVKAFFLEMQMDAKSSGQIIYDSLHSAFSRISDELSKLFTGQKLNIKKMFQELGGSITHELLTSGLQRGLSQLGKVIGPSLSKHGGVLGKLGGIIDPSHGKGPAKTPPSGTQGDPHWMALDPAYPNGSEANPFYVIAMSTGQTPGQAPGSGGGPGGFLAAGLGAFLGSLGGRMPNGGPRAEGGPMTPGMAYLTGEHGPEPVFLQDSAHAMSNALAQRTFGGSSGHVYNVSIDARGTDPVLTEQRTFRAIQMAHDSAVSTSIRATVQRASRVPVGR